MKKMIAVFKREYLQAVRKKMFIIMTFLLPVLMGAVLILPSLLMARAMEEKTVAVLDGTGQLAEAFSDQQQAARSRGRRRSIEPTDVNVDYVNRQGQTNLEAEAKPYLERMRSEKDDRLDGVLLIPADAVTASRTRLKYYSRSSTDIITHERLGSLTNRGLQRLRLGSRGLNADEIDQLLSQASVDAVQVSKTGEQKAGGMANFVVGFIFTALLMLPSFIYGLEIMRGIIQEKTDRVVEVLISSMTPAQLLIGKIMGVAAVGLTQISVWILMGAGVAAFGAAAALAAGVNVLQFLSFSIIVYFVVFFVLAYLTIVCVYAIGGAVCNSEKEAAQLIAPITLVMMLPWFLLIALITSPDSNLAVGFSLAPVFGPVTMFIRTLVSEPPIWHILLSIAVSIATVLAFFWATAKIFRVGILSYGKRPTIAELWRWLRVA
jgi:ABC-2 type transport system permease protein